MKTMRFEKPPLSFKPEILFIEQQENGLQFKIYTDGREIAYVIFRNEYSVIQTADIHFTDNDKDFLINATNLNLKDPKDHQMFFTA